MLSLIEQLPVELVGANVLGYLYLKDIVMLERSCGSKKSHQLFLDMIPYCTPVALPTNQLYNREVLDWFVNRRCKLSSLTIKLSGDNPCLHIKNLQVEYFDLQIEPRITIESFKSLFESNTAHLISCIYSTGNQNREVMEQLSACTRNVKQLKMHYAHNCMDWLTVDILAIWKLTEIHLVGEIVASSFLTLIVQTCSELTSIKLDSYTDHAAVIVIAQHCPKLETLKLWSSNITWSSLLALSERGLPLEELDIQYVPNIPTADIARRCSHALSCVRHLDTCDLHLNDLYPNILIPYMTGLTSVDFSEGGCKYIPSLTQHCHKLTKIVVYNHSSYSVSDILSVCRANPVLQELYCYYNVRFTDTALIQLIHACPHIHTLCLSDEPDITDTAMLALSNHNTTKKWLCITGSMKVTEAAVLQLLQCCLKLTRLDVSSSSLSEETWAQLDKNIQKRVRRW